MKEKLLFKILSSLPLILIMLYFIPFLGICLILLRFLIYNNQKRIFTSLLIAIIGLLIILPKGIFLILKLFNLSEISFLSNLVNNEFYNINLINYSKLLLTIGIVFLIILIILNYMLDKISRKINLNIKKYINEIEKRNIEIYRQNDLKMQIKREKAKITNYVKCPYCGSDNILSEKFGVCKFCRRKIENK